jgi:hypothetical protein
MSGARLIEFEDKLKQTTLDMLDWLSQNASDPADGLAVIMIAGVLLEKTNHDSMKAAAKHASKALAGSDAAGTPSTMLRSYRKIQQEFCGNAIMKLLKETAN